MIKQIDKETFETTFRGRIYTLCRFTTGWGMWNQTLKGRPNPPKHFDNLDAVESSYKHWKGIKQLVTAQEIQPCQS